MSIVTNKTPIIDSPVTLFGDTINGNATMTNVPDTTWIDHGDYIYGANFPIGTFCISKTANTITFSTNATITQIGTSGTLYNLSDGLLVQKFTRVVNGTGLVVAVYKTKTLVKNSLEIAADGYMDLKGDSAAPGSLKVYSTNSLANRGWNSIATLVSSLIYTDTDSSPVTIPAGSTVTGLTLNLPAGSYLLFLYSRIVRQADGQILINVLNGVSTIDLTALEVSFPNVMNNNFNWSKPYSSTSPISLSITYEGDVAQNNGLRERSLMAIKVG